MFSDYIRTIGWEETTRKIMCKTEADVVRALQKRRCDIDDFMAMISPAGALYLEPMARLSQHYTRERFGNTVNLFIPIYLTNSCCNSCVYCGFHVQNKMRRVILTEAEMVREYEAIKQLGPFDNCSSSRARTRHAPVSTIWPERSTWPSLSSATCRSRSCHSKPTNTHSCGNTDLTEWSVSRKPTTRHATDYTIPPGPKATGNTV